MKKITALLLVLLIFAAPAAAFMYEITVLSGDQIAALSDDALLNTYIDVLVEFEAAKTFHQTSGFTPKDYAKHKGLLRYKIDLMSEIKKRKLEVPRVEDQ